MIQINMVSQSLRKQIVPLYRVFSMVSLYGILSGIVLYAVLFAFFLSSNSWVAPFIINPSDPQVLAITGQMVESQTTIDTLQLDYAQSKESYDLSLAQLKDLLAMQRSLDSKVAKQTKVWEKSATDLAQFDAEIQADIATLNKDVSSGAEMRASVDRDLKAGMITREDAISSYSYIDSLAANTTAAKVSENALVDTIRQHKMEDMSSLSVEGQRAALIFQIGQLYSTARAMQAHMESDLAAIAGIERAIKTVLSSPYYLAVSGDQNVRLGVMPYDAKHIVKAGEPVYNCAVGIFACRKVGSIVTVYPNELVFENPLTKTNARGYIVRLNVSASDMREKNLIVGRKPLGF